MRRLLTDAPLARCKTLLIQSGQTAAFAAVALLAAAAAPAVTRETPPVLSTAPVAPPVRPAAATDASSQPPIRTNLRPMESRTIRITPPMPGRAVSSRAASTLSGSPPRLWAAKAVTLAATAQQACHRANSDDGTAVAERAAFVVEGVCRDCGGWTYKRSGRCCSSGA